MNKKYFFLIYITVLGILHLLALQIFCSDSAQSQKVSAQAQIRTDQLAKIKAGISALGQALPVKDVQKIVLNYLAEPMQTWIPTHEISRILSTGYDKIAFSADSRTIALNDGNYVKLWQIFPDKKLIQEIAKKENLGTATDATGASPAIASPLAFSPNGLYFAMLVDNNIYIVQKKNENYVYKEFVPTQDKILSLAFSPHSTILAAGFHDGSVSQWLIRDRSVQQVGLPKQTTIRTYVKDPAIAHLAFSPNGQYLAAANDYIVTVFGQTEDFKKVTWYFALQPLIDSSKVTDTAQITSIGFSPDSNKFATASAYNLKFWELNISNFKLRKKIDNISNLARIAFAPDSKTVALSFWDNKIQFYQRNGYNLELQQTITTTEPARDIAFSPDGHYFAAVFSDHVQIYEIQEHILARELGHTQSKKAATASTTAVTEVD